MFIQIQTTPMISSLTTSTTTLEKALVAASSALIVERQEKTERERKRKKREGKEQRNRERKLKSMVSRPAELLALQDIVFILTWLLFWNTLITVCFKKAVSVLFQNKLFFYIYTISISWYKCYLFSNSFISAKRCTCYVLIVFLFNLIMALASISLNEVHHNTAFSCKCSESFTLQEEAFNVEMTRDCEEGQLQQDQSVPWGAVSGTSSQRDFRMLRTHMMIHQISVWFLTLIFMASVKLAWNVHW